MSLVVAACRSLCDWQAERAELLACRGCGSQWTPDQGWSPRQRDGSVPPGLAAARLSAASSAAAGTADS